MTENSGRPGMVKGSVAMTSAIGPSIAASACRSAAAARVRAARIADAGDRDRDDQRRGPVERHHGRGEAEATDHAQSRIDARQEDDACASSPIACCRI